MACTFILWQLVHDEWFQNLLPLGLGADYGIQLTSRGSAAYTALRTDLTEPEVPTGCIDKP